MSRPLAQLDPTPLKRHMTDGYKKSELKFFHCLSYYGEGCCEEERQRQQQVKKRREEKVKMETDKQV